MAVIAIDGVILAAGDRSWAWGLTIAATAGFFWALGRANRAERLALLFRRVRRVGLVDQYQRSERTDEVWARYRRESEREESTQPGIYWAADEEFEERIAKSTGSVQFFETPVEDDVILRIEGALVTEVIDVVVLQV